MSPLSLLLSAAVALIAIPFAVRLSVRRWIHWAELAADYGATDILNAKYIDSDDAVARLRSQYDAWSTVVKDGTARFCRDLDAHRVQFMDVPASPDPTGFNEEHRYILRATTERVQRLLDLAARLRNGETGLRTYWVPRVS